MRGRPGRRWLDSIYATPDPFDTWEAAQRHAHADLTDRTRDELVAEQERVRLRLLLDPEPGRWLEERHRRLGEAIRRAR